MAQITSLPGTRKRTQEYLDGLVGTEPKLVRILLEGDICWRWSVFVGEEDGNYEFVKGECDITSYKSKGNEITLDGGLMLRSFQEGKYSQGTEEHNQIRNKMETTDYFEVTGI